MTTQFSRRAAKLKTLLCYTGFLGVVFLTPQGALAAVCTSPSTGNNTVAANCTAMTIGNTGVSLTVNNGVTVSATGNTSAGIADTSTGTVIVNNGTITADLAGIKNDGGSITSITNNGAINQTGPIGSPYWLNGALTNISSGQIGTVSNYGDIVGSVYGLYNQSASITTIHNYTGGSIGNISTTAFSGIQNQSGGTIGDAGNPTTTGILNQGGTIAGATYGIMNYGTITKIANSNNGTITGSNNGIANNGTISYITNESGSSITGSFGNWGILGDAAQTSPANFGLVNAGTVSGAWNGISNGYTFNGLYNTGSIVATYNGTDYVSDQGGAAFSNSATITTVLNTGAIAGGSHGIGFLNQGSIATLTNFGTLSGGTGGYGIDNTSGVAFTTLNNAQGGVSPLTYTGILPSTYNIVVLSPSSYGKLSGTSVTGTMTVGVFGATSDGYYNGFTTASTLTGGNTYNGVLSGIAASNLLNTSGTYQGVGWQLQEVGSSGVWNLVVQSSNVYRALGVQTGTNAGNIGAVLDQLHADGNTSISSILTALDNIGSTQSSAAEGSAMNQLLPSQLTPMVVGANVAMNQTTQVIGQHQELLLAQRGSALGRAAGSEYQSGAFWGQVVGGVANKDKTSDAGGYRQTYYGLTAGLDNHINKDAIVGGALSWVHGDAKGSGLLDGSRTNVNNLQITAYGTHRFGPAFINAMAGVGVNWFDQSRQIAFLGETAKANFMGMQYMGKVDAGYDFDLDPVTVTPLAGFQAVRTVNSGYSETGSSANVSVDRQRTSSYTTTVGGKVAASLDTQWGVMTPELKLQWAHDLKSGPIVTAATMAGASFTTSTPRAAADAALVTLATGLKLDDDWSARVEYTGDIRDGYTSHTGLLKLKFNY